MDNRYTEMIVDDAVIHSHAKELPFNDAEQPLTGERKWNIKPFCLCSLVNSDLSVLMPILIFLSVCLHGVQCSWVVANRRHWQQQHKYVGPMAITKLI